MRDITLGAHISGKITNGPTKPLEQIAGRRWNKNDPCIQRYPPEIKNFFEPLSEEIQASSNWAKEIGNQLHQEADDEGEPLNVHSSLLSKASLGSESESPFSTQSFNDFLPLPWHDRKDLCMQTIDKRTGVETSRWTKIVMVKPVRFLD